VNLNFWGENMKTRETEMQETRRRKIPVRDWDHAPVSTEKIRDLVFDWTFYPREEVDQATVENYARALEAGAHFPPIKVGLYQGKKIVVDGFHRVAARQRFLMESIDAQILPFETEDSLFAEAVRLNSSHGKSYTEAELKANIRRLQQYNFDVTEIQTLVHFPPAEIRKEFEIPIVTMTAPSGKTVSYFRNPKTVEPDQNDAIKLIQLKDSLKLCSRWAEHGLIPIKTPETMALVVRCHLALGKVLSNA